MGTSRTPALDFGGTRRTYVDPEVVREYLEEEAKRPI
jgi:hypothetical protein